MTRNKIDDKLFCEIAERLSIDPSEVKKAVVSFFDVIALDAKKLPFNNVRKIFSNDKFQSYSSASLIPHIGRIGPVYSRYIKWRGNEATTVQFRSKSAYRKGFTQDDIEHIAEELLSGNTPVINKKKNSEMFSRVWLVNKNGKKQAHQVIPKDN